MTIVELVAAVKQHATEQYTKGWDVVVECWSDAEIAQELREAEVTTVADAVRVMNSHVQLWQQRRDDVMCQSGEHEKCPHCGAWVYVEDRCRCTAATNRALR